MLLISENLRESQNKNNFVLYKFHFDLKIDGDDSGDDNDDNDDDDDDVSQVYK